MSEVVINTWEDLIIHLGRQYSDKLDEVVTGGSDATCINAALVPASNTITRITTKDAARIYKIPERTIRRWHAEGRTTDPVHSKGRLLWNAEEIEQLAKQRHGRKRLARLTVTTHTL